MVKLLIGKTGAGLILPLFLFAADSPPEAVKWKALGVERAARGDYAGAEEPFHRACLLDPKSPGACLYFGRTLYLLDRFEEALNVLRTVAESDPENPEIYRVQALSLEALGRNAEAETAFRKAIGLHPSTAANEDPAIDYGVFLYRIGRTEAALDPLKSAVERHPDSARAQTELGCALLALDRLQEASVHLERALAIDATISRAHLLLGKTYQRMGKTADARRELEKAK